MAQVMNMMKQMQMQEQQMQQELSAASGDMAQAQNASRTQNPPVPGSQALNQPENQAQAPAESLPTNAMAPGEQNLLPAPTGTNEVPA
jgi:hypothetical protein